MIWACLAQIAVTKVRAWESAKASESVYKLVKLTYSTISSHISGMLEVAHGRDCILWKMQTAKLADHPGLGLF
jgi:hypothetical protein